MFSSYEIPRVPVTWRMIFEEQHKIDSLSILIIVIGLSWLSFITLFANHFLMWWNVNSVAHDYVIRESTAIMKFVVYVLILYTFSTCDIRLRWTFLRSDNITVSITKLSSNYFKFLVVTQHHTFGSTWWEIFCLRESCASIIFIFWQTVPWSILVASLILCVFFSLRFTSVFISSLIYISPLYMYIFKWHSWFILIHVSFLESSMICWHTSLERSCFSSASDKKINRIDFSEYLLLNNNRTKTVTSYNL